MHIFTRRSTNVLRLLAYTDDVTGLPVIDATVTGSVFAQDGTAVTGAQNIAMPYFAASGAIPAQYRGILPSTVLFPNDSYHLISTATNANGVREFNETCTVEDG
jgi:hypothetical protein